MLQLFEILPFWYQYTMIGILGLIIGSFLNVVIYRYHTGKSLNGHSHCLSCGEKLRWYELFPLVSYVCLWGRCRTCGCTIPLRYFLVELCTAVLFILLFSVFPLGLLLLFSMLLIAVLLIVSVYDIYHMVIPNELVILMILLALIYYVLTYGFMWDISSVLAHVGAALGAFLFYGGLWFVSKGRWIGFGDAKLAIPLAFILGPWATFTFIVFSFWVGAIVSLSILGVPVLIQVYKKYCTPELVVNSFKSFTIKSEVPFAPFMIAAFLLVYIFNLNVLTIMALAI